MRSLLRLVVNNPIATVLMVIFMSLVGIYSARHMAVDLFPNLDIPVVNIITHYAGASPEDMELLVSRPIENEIRSIPGVKRVASTSVRASRR
jgi:multidrug efflux pump subunit AcrB